MTGTPTGVPGGRTMIPSWSVPRPSSSSAQIIPSLSTPRIFAFLSVRPPGSVSPTRAKQTTWPSATLGAPQTTSHGRRRRPWSTVQSRSRSAFGWGSTRSTRAVTTPSRPAPSRSTPSTSAVWNVRRAGRLGGIDAREVDELGEPTPGELHPSTPRANWREEPQVAGHEVADVLDAVAHHHEAVDAEAEREARPRRGVDAARAQHVRVDEAAAEELDPAGALADGAALAARRRGSAGRARSRAR